MIGNANLADVMQGGRLEQKVDGAIIIQHSGKVRMSPQRLRQQTDIVLGPSNVIAGFAVARLGERGQGLHRDVLDRLDFPHTFPHFRLERAIPVVKAVLQMLHRQMIPDTRLNNRRADGLGDVIDGAQRQAMHLVARTAAKDGRLEVTATLKQDVDADGKVVDAAWDSGNPVTYSGPALIKVAGSSTTFPGEFRDGEMTALIDAPADARVTVEVTAGGRCFRSLRMAEFAVEPRRLELKTAQEGELKATWSGIKDGTVEWNMGAKDEWMNSQKEGPGWARKVSQYLRPGTYTITARLRDTSQIGSPVVKTLTLKAVITDPESKPAEEKSGPPLCGCGKPLGHPGPRGLGCRLKDPGISTRK